MQTQGGDNGLDGVLAPDQLMEQMAREFGMVLEEALGRIAGGVPAEQANQWAEAGAERLMARVRRQWARGAHEERRGEGAGGRATEDEGEGDAEALSAREIEVLKLVARGLSGQEIADELTITRDTAYKHGENAAAKLGVRGSRRAVETLTPQSYSTGACTYSVKYTEYDAQERVAFTSDAYFQSVTQATCTPSGYLRPAVDSQHPGSSQSYDGLDRVTKAQDAIGNTTTTTYSIASPQGTNVSDTAPYEATSVVDANAHQHVSLVDGFGRTRYAETFTGNTPSGPSAYALYGTSAESYDWLGDVTSVTGPNPPPAGAAGLSTSAQTTTTYDLLGRQTGMSDADLGNNWTYSYDANGNLLESVASNGANGTVWHGYDGLNREVWRNTANSGTTPTPYVQETYDTATNGVGRLATESFNQGASLGAGTYSYTYDARGQVTSESVTLDGTNFPLGFGYNDAGQPQTVTYSDGEVLALSYNGQGWLAQAQTTPYQGTAIPLATQLGYSGVGGAAEHPTSASVANGTYSYAASYDNDLRLSSASLSLANPATTLYSTARSYDGVGNVTSAQTTLAAGTDAQAFCYDEQNRLVWASSQSATNGGPCGAQNTAGSLTAQGAQYTASYAYDALNRLTSSPLGTYAYASAHLHAASSVTSGSSTVYSAQYGNAGSMYCRAASSTTTCEGSTFSGAWMAYDHEGRLVSWQNTWSNPTQTASYAYDGAGSGWRRA